MKYSPFLNRLLVAAFSLLTSLTINAESDEKPNVVIVITDDQGYGDLGFTGNPVIQTPYLDQLRTESTLLDNFHVDPTCAPTRAALMTGRHSNRVGVWHTVQGRSMLRKREVTMADVFAENGYATALFGKWHLGDCYPFRPEDRGFQHTVYHSAGGIGQSPDYWDNDYFDDTYYVNGELQRFEGYCTDVWFEEGMKFIKENKDKPFLAYISPNAPHGPAYCPLEYVEPYEDDPYVSMPEFYGMVTNIDDNMGILVKFLEEEGLADNTILIFMTDNGTGYGLRDGRGYDGGMRGKKGSQYDGGHRVPFMIRWPNGKIEEGKTIEELTAHMDVLPTLIELCELDAPAIEFDGADVSDLLYTDAEEWPDRALIVENQRVIDPIKWRRHSVMTNNWRLVDGRELYNMQDDPKQTIDVAGKHPEIFNQLRTEYEKFWADVSQEHNLVSYMAIGSEESPIVALSSHDWLYHELPAWDQKHILNGDVAVETHWAIEVEQAGEYEISLRRWPVEVNKGINDDTYGKGFNYKQARLRIGENIDITQKIPREATEVTFKVTLEKGLTKLAPLFIGKDLQATPYYAYVTHKPEKGWQTPEGMGVPVFDPSYGERAPQRPKL
ncbi:arylsulfatase [Puniceicoccaceae bacterium K14]|nr:arylsulfatase [Puniceicoccaceae bacterium K14]